MELHIVKPKKIYGDVFFLLVVVTLATDLFFPYLIWKEIIPDTLRWISHASIALMIFVTYSRMMVFDHFPKVAWLIICISLISGFVAFMNNQGPLATLWGWWTMFQYPFVGLFAYLQPSWPKKFPKRIVNFLIAILCIEVVIQFGQYVLGERPGDNLAGLFGWHGTGNLVIFILLVLSFALGAWLAKGNWLILVFVLVVGAISSVLGEIKLFPFAAAGLGVLSIFFIILRKRSIGRLIPYTALLAGILAVFFISYNAIVPAAQTRPLESFFETQTLGTYLEHANKIIVGDQYYYDVGRNYALSYAWDKITEDGQTFLIGLGLGARGESQTLGTAGVGILGGELGITTGTSLLVILQEVGIVGFLILGSFFLWLGMRLFRDIRADPRSNLTVLRYGILLFSMLWPLWLWYGNVWVFRVPMLIYWVVIGYLLSHSAGAGAPVTAAALIQNKDVRQAPIGRELVAQSRKLMGQS
jgi:hypothetical protein